MAATQFARPPPTIPDDIVLLSFPAPHVLHVALNRPKAYNAMSRALNATLSDVFDWYEEEPSLWVAVLGSTNRKAWCAGADLKEWVSS
jgi:enoyl-CoA hydratase/carnithine racemase